MSPIWKSLLALLVGFAMVLPPFLLGRALGPNRCKNCARRHAMAATRARENGEAVAQANAEAVARLRQRSISPDDVRRQAEAGHHERIHLLRDEPELFIPRQTGGAINPADPHRRISW